MPERLHINKVARSSSIRLLAKVQDDRLLLLEQNSVQLWPFEGPISIGPGGGRIGVSRATANDVAHDPTQDRFLLGGFMELTLCDRDLNTLRQWDAHDSIIHAVAFSPDGHVAASVGSEGHVALWDTKSLKGIPRTLRKGRWGEIDEGTPILRLEGLKADVRWVSFSDDGERLAAGGDDGHVVMWNRAGVTVATSPDLGGRSWCGAFRPGSTELAVGLAGKQVAIVEEGGERTRGWATEGSVGALEWLHADVLITVTSFGSIIAWDVDSGAPLASVATPKGTNHPTVTVAEAERLVLITGGAGIFELQ